jgi:hypothetical protein
MTEYFWSVGGWTKAPRSVSYTPTSSIERVNLDGVAVTRNDMHTRLAEDGRIVFHAVPTSSA